MEIFIPSEIVKRFFLKNKSLVKNFLDKPLKKFKGIFFLLKYNGKKN